MKATVRFSLEIDLEIDIEKEITDVTIMELELKASNLRNSLYDVLKHMDTAKLLNEKINTDYSARFKDISIQSKRKIII